MRPVWGELLLRTVGRWGLALLVLFSLLALSAVPLEIIHLGEIRPVFMLMAVYYWTILRPSLLPPLLVFIIGIILDLLAVYPLGMHALILVVAQLLTRSQRKFLLGQSFPVIWACFALIAFGSGAVQWLLFALFNLAFIPVKPMLMSVAISVFLFPVLAVPLSMVHKALADDGAAMP